LSKASLNLKGQKIVPIFWPGLRLFDFPEKTSVFPAGPNKKKEKLGQFSALLNLGRPWTSPDFGPFGTECGSKFTLALQYMSLAFINLFNLIKDIQAIDKIFQ
jgi:hypothetical protein